MTESLLYLIGFISFVLICAIRTIFTRKHDDAVRIELVKALKEIKLKQLEKGQDVSFEEFDEI
jgi:uncharacterized membrane protein YoaK (UPF0700 family)